jgi:hypothetical protein
MNANPVYWKQRNGVLISIDDMDINHLRNTLKMIVKNSNKHKVTITKGLDLNGNVVIHKHNHNNPKIISNIKLNGDMANEFNNTNLSDEDDDRFEFIY